MKIKRVFAPVAAAVLAFSLTACGDDEAATEGQETQVEQSEDNQDDKSDEKSDEKSDDKSDEKDNDQGGNDDLPTREDVASGLTDIFNGSGIEGMTPELSSQIATCIADDIYDDLSPESIESLASGRDVMQGEPDYDMVFESSRACTENAVGSSSGGDTGTNTSGSSREDVISGLNQIFMNAGIEGLTPEISNQIATCIADDIYDDLSPESIESLASGRDVMQGEPDYDMVFESSRACTEQVTQG